MRKAVALICAWGLALGPSRGWAQAVSTNPEAIDDGRPSLAVLAVGRDVNAQVQGLRAAQLLEDWARASGRFRVVRWSDALNPTAARARDRAVQDAREAAGAGMKAYGDLDTQKAQKQFERAVRAYELSDLSLHFSELSKAWVMKIACSFANGDAKAADSELGRLLAIDPAAEFLPNYFSPDQLRQVERARRRAAESANGLLRINSDPVRAKVYLDGKFRGISPTILEKVPPGDHYLTLHAPGYALTQGRSRGGNVKLTLRPSEKGNLGLESSVQRLIASNKASVRDREARELGNLVGTDQIVLLIGEAPNAERLKAVALRLDVRDGHTLGFEEQTLPTGLQLSDEVEGLAARLMGSDARRREGTPVTERGGGFEWTRRTTGYTLLGAGALLLTAGILWGLSAKRADNDYQALPQTDPGSASLRSRGKRAALLADLSFVGAAAAVGVGTWFTFFGQSASPSAGRPERATTPLPSDVEPSDRGLRGAEGEP